MGNIVDAFLKDIPSFLSESKIVSVFYNRKIPNFSQHCTSIRPNYDLSSDHSATMLTAVNWTTAQKERCCPLHNRKTNWVQFRSRVDFYVDYTMVCLYLFMLYRYLALLNFSGWSESGKFRGLINFQQCERSK